MQINAHNWPIIAEKAAICLTRKETRPMIFRIPFKTDYLFVATFACVPDSSHDITRSLTVHFHTDIKMKKVGQISVKWSKALDFDPTESDPETKKDLLVVKHIIKKGPNNRSLNNLSTDIKDANSLQIANSIAECISKTDYISKMIFENY